MPNDDRSKRRASAETMGIRRELVQIDIVSLENTARYVRLYNSTSRFLHFHRSYARIPPASRISLLYAEPGIYEDFRVACNNVVTMSRGYIGEVLHRRSMRG